MICSNCQTQNPDGKKFCRECGKPLNAIQPETIKTVPKKKSRWWIWLILIVVLAVAAYFLFFAGGMGPLIQFNTSKSSSKTGTEKQFVEKLIASMRNNDLDKFLDNQCVSRADLAELNSLLPEDEKFEIKSMLKEFESIEKTLLRGLNHVLTRSREKGVDWSQAKVISVTPEQLGDNPKLLRSITTVIESNDLQFTLFFEACAKFTTGWKVCKEIEWVGLNQVASSGDNSQPVDKVAPATEANQETGSEVYVDEVRKVSTEKNPPKEDRINSEPITPETSDDGYVIFTAENGATFLYKGDIKDGQANGVGRASLPDESVYEGEFQNNMFHGEGTQTFKDGIKYTGSFENGLRNGNGTIYWTDGSFFTGEWVNGNRTGYGVYTWADGTYFDGQWIDGEKIHGLLKFANNNTYEGDFKANLYDGQGTYTWTNGNKYTGEYRNGKRDGKGTFIWADGQRYEGDFQEDYRTGNGTYYWPGGIKFTGTFQKNNRVKGLMTYENGNTYNGDYQNDKKHGFGIFTWTDGRKYEGYWAEDNRNGSGTYWWKDGSYWKGNFKDNLFEGAGVEYYADGRIKARGTWIKGVLQK